MDVFGQRLALTGLIVIAVLSVVSCVALSLREGDHSVGLCQLAATCAGALAGLAWPSQRSGAPPTSSA